MIYSSRNNIIIIIVLICLVSIKIVLLDNVLSTGTIGPQCLNDELLYRLNSESLFNKEPYYSDHYPPFYPLLLSFAFFSKDNWYQWMFFINAFLTSLVLIPLWFISLRFLSRVVSLAVLLIGSLSALHFFYPGLIMSENLHVPVFVFSLFLLLETGNGPIPRKPVSSALLGISMALGYMTKYLFLMAIPVFVLLWFIKPLFSNVPEERKINVASRRFELLAMSAGFLSVFVPWFIYKYFSGFGRGGGIGAEFVLSGIPEVANLKSLVLWSGFYLSYSILALAPFLFVLVFYTVMILSKKIQHERQETFFILAVILMSAIFFMTGVQHSWRCNYNYPLPYKIHGRYLMHLLPLWIIIFMIALNKVKNVLTGSNLTSIIYSCILCFALLCVPLGLLVLSDYAHTLTEGYPEAPDGLLYRTKAFIAFLGAIYIVMGIIFSLCRKYGFVAKHYVILISILVIAMQTHSAFTAYNAMLTNRTDYQLHGRALLPFIAQEVMKNHDEIVVVTDQAELLGKTGMRIEQSLQFRVAASASIPSIKFISFNDFFSHEGNGNKKLFIISTKLNEHSVYNYMVKKINYYVYDIDTWPEIITDSHLEAK